MRLINLRPSPTQQAIPLVVMAVGDKDGEVCHHYRTTHDHGTSMDIDGLDIVIAGEEIAGGGEPDGLTVDSILAICEDRAKSQSSGNHRMHLVAMQLLAARRALAVEESSGVTHSAAVGSDSRRSANVHATALA